MKVENIIIIALVAAVLYFGFLKKPSQSAMLSTGTQLPPPQQNADGDGGAARALITEGAGIITNLIDHAFESSAENTPPQTASFTI